MQVRDAMASTIGIATPRDSVSRVAQLMREEDAGFIPVCEDLTLLGVITDRDIVIRCVAEGHTNLAEERVEQCMTRSPQTVEATADIDAAARIMEEHEVRRLLVVEGGKLVGILSHGNLVQALHSDGQPTARRSVSHVAPDYG